MANVPSCLRSSSSSGSLSVSVEQLLETFQLGAAATHPHRAVFEICRKESQVKDFFLVLLNKQQQQKKTERARAVS